ncbi:MAG: hypothetical protein HY294_05525 [Candidatus Rokubacteria bacterium]|nr:hypothetical protein [Candidatus Rokubacteria bacterium]MBI3825435.1 hypothetical protein [Candidatus Rokubacteria bacterium]
MTTQSLTEWLQQSRLLVVAVDPAVSRIRVRGVEEVCTDLSCSDQTLVVSDEGAGRDLGALNPGDIVRVESEAGRATRIVVVRRVWEELTSPEW